MRFLLDESSEYRLASHLRARGHDVTAIAHDYPGALTDDAVLAIAQAEARVLITNDRDFGELVIRGGAEHHGVIYFRLRVGDMERKIRALDALLSVHPDWLGQFIIIDRGGAHRRRRSSSPGRRTAAP